MTHPKTLKLNLRLLTGSATIVAGSLVAAVAQTNPPQQQLPNFIDSRPLPQTERAKQDEAEARRKADEELKRLSAEAEVKRRAEEDAKRAAAEADAKRRADEDAKRLAAEAEAKRLATEADAKRRADDEANRLAAATDAKRRADEEAKRLAAEADARKRTEDEAKRLATEADARKRAEDDAKRQAAEVEARRLAAEAEAKRMAAEAEAKRLAVEAEARRQAEADARRAAAEAEARRQAATATRSAEAAAALERGRSLIGDGDFAGARLVLERAAQAGDADAAFALADTFDPGVLERAGVIGVSADAGLAQRWRARAAELRAARTSSVTAAEARVEQERQRAADAELRRAEDRAIERRRTAIAAEQQRTASNTARPPVAPPPAAAPPQASAPPSSPDAMRFIARGRQLLQTGDIEAARGFFERSLNLGSADAALEMGATYDPVELKQLGVFGIAPDVTLAVSYYKKAQQMGHGTAAERLRRLGAP